MSAIKYPTRGEILQENEKLRVEIEQLQNALRPFALAAESLAEMPFPDGDRWLWKPSRSHGPEPAGISAEHLRIAKEALLTKDSEGLPCCGSESGVHLIGCRSEDALAGRIHRPSEKNT